MISKEKCNELKELIKSKNEEEACQYLITEIIKARQSKMPFKTYTGITHCKSLPVIDNTKQVFITEDGLQASRNNTAPDKFLENKLCNIPGSEMEHFTHQVFNRVVDSVSIKMVSALFARISILIRSSYNHNFFRVYPKPILSKLWSIVRGKSIKNRLYYLLPETEDITYEYIVCNSKTYEVLLDLIYDCGNKSYPIAINNHYIEFVIFDQLYDNEIYYIPNSVVIDEFNVADVGGWSCIPTYYMEQNDDTEHHIMITDKNSVPYNLFKKHGQLQVLFVCSLALVLTNGQDIKRIII